MRDIPYELKIGSLENVYRDNRGHLVLFRGASLPDVCVACGAPAYGNTIKKEFDHHGFLWHLPSLLCVAYLIFGKRYLMTLPFCPNCTPDDFSLRPDQIDDHVATFTGTSNTFLKSVPQLPSNLDAETNESWFQRTWRQMWG